MFNTESEFERWILSSISLAITAVLVVWMWQTDRKFIAIALALIVGVHWQCYRPVVNWRRGRLFGLPLR